MTNTWQLKPQKLGPVLRRFLYIYKYIDMMLPVFLASPKGMDLDDLICGLENRKLLQIPVQASHLPTENTQQKGQ